MFLSAKSLAASPNGRSLKVKKSAQEDVKLFPVQ
jgi:hypothetical protein